MRALKIERVRIDSLFFTPHNYSCLDVRVTVRQHHIMEAIAAAAASTAATTSTCKVLNLWTKTYSQDYIKFSDYNHQFYVKFGD